MNVKKGLLIVYSGPSGVGKNTVREHFAANKDLNIVYSVSMTTRPRRPGETEGVDYFFVDRAEFERAIAADQMLEYAEFVGNYYGTPRWWVERMRAAGKNVLLEIEVQGALQVMERVPDCVTIFLIPPSAAELERRLRLRGSESEDKIRLRLAKASEEMSQLQKYRFVVVNDDAKRAGAEIARIIKRCERA